MNLRHLEVMDTWLMKCEAFQVCLFIPAKNHLGYEIFPWKLLSRVLVVYNLYNLVDGCDGELLWMCCLEEAMELVRSIDGCIA